MTNPQLTTGAVYTSDQTLACATCGLPLRRETRVLRTYTTQLPDPTTGEPTDTDVTELNESLVWPCACSPKTVNAQ